ncbi:MAG TPA: hypothetical protein VFY27_10540, partial [Woeseiaceae bacterium]|nr:hypothetical protein [Woeseiaceae bacterium]
MSARLTDAKLAGDRRGFKKAMRRLSGTAYKQCDPLGDDQEVVTLEVDAKQQPVESEYDRKFAEWCLSLAGNPRISIKLWDGTEYYSGKQAPIAGMEIRDRASLLALLRSLSMGF